MEYKKIDFTAINAAALPGFALLLHQWLPGGDRSGGEYVAKNPMRNDSHAGSFSINVNSGVWNDFATGDGGSDPISLFAYLFHSNDQGAAAKALAEAFGIHAQVTQPSTSPPKPPKTFWSAIEPPVDAPPPHRAHIKRGFPERMWCYRSASGTPLGYMYRFKTSDGGKEVLPLSWCRHGESGAEEWRWMAFAEPRWLYGLDRLSDRPDAPVLVVEGEPCADVAAAELPGLVCVTWPGGCKAVDKSDWSPLAGRNVFIWPDCDSLRDKAGELLPESKQPGLMAATKIANTLVALGCRVWLVSIPPPGELKHGWDIVV